MEEPAVIPQFEEPTVIQQYEEPTVIQQYEEPAQQEPLLPLEVQQEFDETFVQPVQLPEKSSQGYEKEIKAPVQLYQAPEAEVQEPVEIAKSEPEYVQPVQIPEQPVQILDEPVQVQEEPSFQVEQQFEQELPYQPQPIEMQKVIEQFAQKQTKEKLGGGVELVQPVISANKQSGRGRPTRPPRPPVVQRPEDDFFLQGFPEVAAPEGGDVPLEEQAAIREAIFELKKERRSG